MEKKIVDYEFSFYCIERYEVDDNIIMFCCKFNPSSDEDIQFMTEMAFDINMKVVEDQYGGLYKVKKVETFTSHTLKKLFDWRNVLFEIRFECEIIHVAEPNESTGSIYKLSLSNKFQSVLS